MVGQRVDGLPAVPFYPDQAGSAQNPEVLGHQRLAHPEQVDQLVHEPRLISQLRDDRQPGPGPPALSAAPPRPRTPSSALTRFI